MCECDQYWSGPGCQEFSGSCHPKCLQEANCNGISEEHCGLCNLHAHREDDGKCACDPEWGGEDCQVYTGECATICDGCFGPEDCDCKRCVTNAKMNDETPGTCECIENWTGEKCEIFSGECSLKCKEVDGHDCKAPGDAGCVECREHSILDPTGNGNCICDSGWGDKDC